jgi:integrase
VRASASDNPAWHAHRATELQPQLYRRITKARVPKITVHGTRKTCGSLLAVLDVHPSVAMEILRHSKIAVAMEICTKIERSWLSARTSC